MMLSGFLWDPTRGADIDAASKPVWDEYIQVWYQSLLSFKHANMWLEETPQSWPFSQQRLGSL
jgi:hypothetical protein